ncbi:hypothetical protein TRFO_15945 [Tritrichomonas foetus]|uniref:Uncharacterized protein n=1 Tax=Tritrichomonas foetus TaxID=1144522 RepID=A0A1J4KRD5_9EUKA|nr:hypothetical protein TRFO_15945 [Tritrichomonas foetus]|eukprot:OHT13823.1 hypothetical protein TRFO_15945 [Tritrichomonas foetus]
MIIIFFYFFLTYSWRNQEYTINKEFEMQVQDLQINREQALSDLDNEWASPKKQQSYSKPSPALLNMRHMAKKMIRTQQFEEVKKLARLIEDKERQEIESAAKRMNDDYHIADQRLKEQFDHELQVIESMHEMKIHNITRSRDQSLRPLYQRIENLQKMKDQATKQQKKTTQLVMTTTPRKRANATSANTPRMSSRMNQRGAMQVSKKSAQTPQKQLPQLLVTPKLALPPVQRIKREAPKSQLSNQSQNPTQASASSAIVRPKTFSRLSNTPDKNSQKKMPNGSLMYH